MKRILFFVLTIAPVILACSSSKKAASSVNEPTGQGISGTVTELAGNQMPMRDAPAPQPRPVLTTVLVYEPTQLAQVMPVAPGSNVYTIIRTKQVASAETDSTGAFRVALPVGSYSLFVKHPNGFYANLFDTANRIALFRVEEGKLTQARLTISNRASF